MKLIIHAGIHRTGSSSLQNYFAENRASLLKQGIFYPGESKNHQQLAWAIKRGEAGSENVLSMISGFEGGSIVLSAEDFCIHKDLSWLSEVASRISTKAYFYLRRQDHWLMSWYNQHIKWPFDKSKSRMNPAEFLDRIDDFYWIDFSRLIKCWQDVLGAGSVHVAIVEPGQVEDVTDDFVSNLGISGDELTKPAERINNSMPIHLLEVARHLGLYEMPGPLRIKMLSTLRRAFPAGENMPATVYSPTQRRAILDRFTDSNATLARDRFNRTELFLEDAPQDSDPYYRFPDISLDEYMQDWIKPLVRQLLK